ncbi:MAG: ribonuclease Z [Dorea sp.]|jgi:hypothetical protein|nr:ribonuclease Z [Dorea sp.]
MIVIAAIDDNKGMMFNKRRQSKDSAVIKRILSLSGCGRLWMNTYTYQQFSGCDTSEICVDEEFLYKAGAGEYCFVEDHLLAPWEKEIEEIILFKWNRKYPSDLWFDIDVGSPVWKLIETKEFTGSSHERITEEVYVRG